ncbi:23S RNA-specific pseudouridylate synthase, partial [Thiovulum sp. ES]
MTEIFNVENGGRLDKFLAEKLNESRSQVEKLIENGFVEVNKKRISKSGFKVSSGDEVVVEIREAEKSESEFEIDFD